MNTQAMSTHREQEEGGGWLGLGAFLAACGGFALGMWWLTGPPTMLISMPDWSHVREVLAGSQLDDRDVITFTTGIAWLVLGYVLLSTLLRLLLGLVASVPGQARWARDALRLTAPLTIPLVRRVVDGALAGTILVSASLHAPSALSASSLSMPIAVEAPLERPALVSASSLAPVPDTAPTAPERTEPMQTLPATYTVVWGDNLWRIAERHLGDGFRWLEIWTINQGQEMSDGRRFVDPDLIHPGWVLDLPQDAVELAPPAEADAERADPPPEPEPAPPSQAEPKPTPPPPAPEPTAGTAGPGPTPTAAPAAPVTSSDDTGTSGGIGTGLEPRMPELPLPDAALAAAGASLMASAVAMLLVFRRHRHRLVAHEQRHEVGDAGRVSTTTAALNAALRELDFAASRVLLVREREKYLEYTLDCPPGDANALVEARYTLGRQLACAVDGAVDGPTTVRLKVSRMSHLAAEVFAEAGLELPLLVPVGASDSGVYYLNLSSAGSVLVSGGRLETRELLTSWLQTFGSLHPDDSVGLVADGSAWEHLEESFELLPCLEDAGTSGGSLPDFARGLEELLLRRGNVPGEPAVLAFVGPHPDPLAAAAELGGALQQGPERGVFVIAMAEAPERVDARQSFAAAICFGGGDDEAAALGGMTLRVPRHAPLDLEAVVVRRQVAWRPRPQELEREQSRVPSPSPNGTAPPEADPPGRGDPVDVRSEAVVPLEPGPPPSPNGHHQPGEDAAGVGPIRQPSDGTMDRQPVLPLDRGDSPESGHGPPFRATLFGTFRIETATGDVNNWTIQKARELLAYLLVHGGSPVLRERVGEALWPESDPDYVNRQLPNAAYRLRRALACALDDIDARLLVTANQRYHLRPGLFQVDVDAFDAHLARAERLEGYDALVEYERALGIYKGDLLSGEAYEWAEVYRQDYERRFVEAARRAAKLAFDARDPRRAIGFYEAILSRDPADEEAVRGLMCSQAALGDTNAARRAYQNLREALRRTLDDASAEPLPETKRVLDELLDGRGPAR